MRQIPYLAVALLLAAVPAGAQVVTLDDALFAGLQPVTVAQTPDVVYSKDVRYTAYPLAQVLVEAYPDWKRLIERDAVLIMRASGGYEPFMLFSEAFAGRAFVAVSLAGRMPDDPYDCWTEGGEQHCDLGYFVIWTDGLYPDRPQPWGTYELEVVRYEDAFGDTIPVSDDAAVHAGYTLYKQYCIECHRINFQGGRKATDHVVRGAPLTRELLDFFVRDYRKANPATYMPDFGEVLSAEQVDALYRYIRHMSENQNLCRDADRDPRCPAG
ncbi:MAG: cytochrome c [Pseudomonadota bacterium]